METTICSNDIAVADVYMGRYRGKTRNENSFAVSKSSRGITWYIEPINQCASPEKVIEVHLIQDNDLLLVGNLTRKNLDFSLVRLSLDDVCKVIVITFRVPQSCAPYLSWFIDAQVSINSILLDIGSVRDIIKKSDLGF